MASGHSKNSQSIKTIFNLVILAFMNYFMQCSFVKLNLTGNNNHLHVTYCSFAFMVGLFFS